jgi:hypothetical protein
MLVVLNGPISCCGLLAAALFVVSCGDEMQSAPAGGELPGEAAPNDTRPRLGAADMVGESTLPADDRPDERPPDHEARPFETCEPGVLEVRGPLALDTRWNHCAVAVVEVLTVPRGGRLRVAPGVDVSVVVGAPVSGRMLDKSGSKIVITTGTSLLTLGIFLLSFFPANWTNFFVAGILIGLGLAALLGAPIRYIMLNEAPVEDRAAAQGVITIFTGIGQLTSGALIGAVAASFGGGVTGYSSAYGGLGLVAILMILLALGLKSRATELAAIARNKATPHVGPSGDKVAELASPPLSGEL